MTKKFTEEEYQKIAEIADNQIKEHNRSVITATSSFLETVRRECQKVIDYNKLWDLEQEFIIICLPKYRDWAHKQFVDKEKKYYWRRKKNDKDGDSVYLDIDAYGVMAPNSFYSHQIDCQPFTESEVIEAGYNPDYYWKEEVE